MLFALWFVVPTQQNNWAQQSLQNSPRLTHVLALPKPRLMALWHPRSPIFPAALGDGKARPHRSPVRPSPTASSPALGPDWGRESRHRQVPASHGWEGSGGGAGMEASPKCRREESGERPRKHFPWGATCFLAALRGRSAASWASLDQSCFPDAFPLDRGRTCWEELVSLPKQLAKQKGFVSFTPPPQGGPAGLEVPCDAPARCSKQGPSRSGCFAITSVLLRSRCGRLQQLWRELSRRHGRAAVRGAGVTVICTRLAGGAGATEPAPSPTLVLPTLRRRKGLLSPRGRCTGGRKMAGAAGWSHLKSPC